MGTNCAPLLVDLFWYSYEAKFIQMLLPEKKQNILWPLFDFSIYRSCTLHYYLGSRRPGLNLKCVLPITEIFLVTFLILKECALTKCNLGHGGPVKYIFIPRNIEPGVQYFWIIFWTRVQNIAAILWNLYKILKSGFKMLYDIMNSVAKYCCKILNPSLPKHFKSGESWYRVMIHWPLLFFMVKRRGSKYYAAEYGTPLSQTF
jgi:hypothetical protein